MNISIEMDNVIIAAAIVIVMFISMRLLYGYWPWQRHPRLRRVRKEPNEPWPKEGFNFQPVDNGQKINPLDRPPPIGGSAGYKPPLAVEIRNGEDHYDRGYNDNGTEKGKPGPQRSEPEGMAHPQADDENKNKA